MSEPITLTREELYQAVWEEPMKRLATRFGVSDVGLAKICRRASIPRPGRGYWEKKRHGKRVTKKPLPRLRNAGQDPQTITIHPFRPPEEPGGPEGPVELQRAFEKAHPIVVSENLDSLSRLVRRTRASLRRAKKDDRGLKRPAEQGCLNVAVSPVAIDRAVAVLEALVRAVGERGWELRPSEGEKPGTSVLVEGEWVHFLLEEKTLRVEKPPRRERYSGNGRLDDSYSWSWRTFEHVPTGDLSLTILDDLRGRRRSWKDGKRQRLETRLNSFMIGLVAAALVIREGREERERWHREWEERERARLERLQREEEERQRRVLVKGTLDRWREARELRACAAAVQEAAATAGSAGDSLRQLVDLVPWMLAYADKLDPLR